MSDPKARAGKGSAEPKLPRFGLYYDFRNPKFARRSFARVYAETIEQAAWAERELGFGSCWISEHHLAVDGYTPSPLTLAATVAMKTEQMKIGTSILILPLQHPIRVAEDALTVHAISGGRFMLGVGMGYRENEFAGFDVPIRTRRGRFEEGIAILRGAFAGKPFSHRGRHYDLGEIEITPTPDPGGGPELWIGGFAPPAIERGARVGDGMLIAVPALWDLYKGECAKQGRTPRIACAYHWVLGDDPEAELAASVPYLAHQVNEYGGLGAYGPADQWKPVETAADLLARSPYQLMDADGAADLVVEAARAGVEDVHFWTVFPGEPIERSNARLEYFARKVVPRVRERLGLAAA